MRIDFHAIRVALSTVTAMVLCTSAAPQPGKLTVSVDKPGAKISPMLYGLMTEEINHSYDGGIYGELIQNRDLLDGVTRLGVEEIFNNTYTPAHWSLASRGGSGGISLGVVSTGRRAASKSPSASLTLTISQADSNRRVGVTNDGYWGVPVLPHTKYHASFSASSSNDFRGPLTVAIETADGTTTWASARVPHIGTEAKRYTVTLTTGAAPRSTNNRFVIYAESKGEIAFQDVSLFGPTFNNRRNGNRIDLMQKLAAMKPAFLRLPGGNYLEGDTFAERFAWKDTIGDIWQRSGHRSPWGYRSSDGLGLLEYLEWCEDLKMEPILAVFAGYVLRGQHVDAGPDLQPYVDEALDEIEYVTGDKSTKWGAVRAANWHPAPFKLTYVEIGNEDSFDRSRSYDGRFTQFFDAIRAKYPNLKLIATTPVRSRVPDVVDDHYYRSAADMERDVHHYDNYSRSGPKIFVGEWASTEGSPTPTLQAALGDAAWMTGMERNSDLIPISCYAPLFVNVNPGARQWGTNLIGYDAVNSFGSPSYYVQAMFGRNKGDVVLPVSITPQAAPAPPAPPMPAGAVGVGTWATRAEFRDMKVTADGRTLYDSNSAGLDGWHFNSGGWRAASGVLSQSLTDTNCRATNGSTTWTDYIYSVKARKLSGAEGFLVMFHVRDESNFLWWNVGGWGNTRTAIEKVSDGTNREIGRVSDVTIESNRWYDIRIEVSGRRIRCYLDDRLITEANDTPGNRNVDPLYATASRVLATGDVIVKVVNVSAADQQLQVDLQGAVAVGKASLEVISGSPSDVNSIAQPEKVAPKKMTFKIKSPTFPHTFPAHSVSVMRLHCPPTSVRH